MGHTVADPCFAGTRFLPCWLTGHTLAFVGAVGSSLVVIFEFRRRLLQLRRGDNPYKAMLQKVPISKFSNTATPALAGVVSPCSTTYFVHSFPPPPPLPIASQQSFERLHASAVLPLSHLHSFCCTIYFYFGSTAFFLIHGLTTKHYTRGLHLGVKMAALYV